MHEILDQPSIFLHTGRTVIDKYRMRHADQLRSVFLLEFASNNTTRLLCDEEVVE